MEYTREAIVAKLNEFVAGRQVQAEKNFAEAKANDEVKQYEWQKKYAATWREFSDNLVSAIGANQPITESLLPAEFVNKYDGPELQFAPVTAGKVEDHKSFEQRNVEATIVEVNSLTNETLTEVDLAVLGIEPTRLFANDGSYPLTTRRRRADVEQAGNFR